MSFASKSALLLLLVANAALQVTSFAFVKLAALNSIGYFGMFLNVFYALALMAIVIRAVVWQLILKRANLSKVYPLNAVVPVLILVVGVMFFHETATRHNMLGALIIIPGILLLVKKG